MGEDGGDVEASRAFNIHEEGVGGLDQSFELVLALLVSEGRVAEILRHFYRIGLKNTYKEKFLMSPNK